MNEYLNVLWAVKRQAQSYQSDYVRKHIKLVNEASSRGHISCLSTAGKNMMCWTLTTSGQEFLSAYGGAV